MIVATAGHVDHGKTELVRALTGVDTDRLPEEKTRGLSIDLGFAYRPLAGNSPLGFVDVPGHEKFVRNMLAGVGGIDLGLLVVAADDGVMPQTREHFAILDLLGIDQCLVAITKTDRVDADRVRQVRNDVATLLGNAGRADVEVFPVCAPANDGIDALRMALDARGRELPQRTTEGHFRMAIDRSFSLRGIGPVVTGMVLSGGAAIDDELVASGNGRRVRIRGIRALDQASDLARAGERCALNIAGRGVSERSMTRGDWLLHPRMLAPTRRIDVDLRVLESEARALKHWTAVHLHVGAARIAARVAVLEGGSIGAGERGLAQLVLARDACVATGDRFVLRDQSARRTMAGGHVVDPFAPQRGRARSARITALGAMNRQDPGGALHALAACSDAGVPLSPFAVARNLLPAQVTALLASPTLICVGPAGSERVFSTGRWQNLLARIEASIAEFHRARPALPGASPEDIQRLLHLPVERPVIEAASVELVQAGRLGRRGARLNLPAHEMPIDDMDRQLLARAATCLAPASGSPPSLHQAAEALAVDRKVLEAVLKRAVRTGEMASIASNRYVPSAYLAQLARDAEALAAKSTTGGFTVAEYCAATGTGRNFAIDLLEYFDRLGFTRRSDNRRQVLRPAAHLFAAKTHA
ncbi:MAG: selenocysteine-specific translation elongation factor [Gammaproteobacteria bacterium]|nr:selenocysteine-specific translation elongation factor [Gammaproteobacteria bacterium]